MFKAASVAAPLVTLLALVAEVNEHDDDFMQVYEHLSGFLGEMRHEIFG